MTPELVEIYDEYMRIQKRLKQEINLENANVAIIKHFENISNRFCPVFKKKAWMLINEKLGKDRIDRKEKRKKKSEEQKNEEKKARKKEYI